MLFELLPFLVANKLVLFGLISGVLSIVAFVPYVVDMLYGKTRPDRACWLIWATLSSIAFVSQVYEGATTSLWFAGVQAGGTVLVCVLSLWIGVGHYLSRKNLMLFILAGIGLFLWYLTDTAIYALIIAISISFLGGAVTVVKAYKSPQSETISTWMISLLASVCAVFSVGALDIILLAYPLYLLTLYSAIVLATWLARWGQRPFSVGLTIPS